MGLDRSRLPEPLTHFEGEGLTPKGPGKWKTAACSFHGGSDSMRIHAGSGAWVCMSCGEKGGDVIAYQMRRHGQEFIEACKALGAWVDDGRTTVNKPLPFSARSALEVIRSESLLVAVAACNVAKGIKLAGADLERLVQAAGRIEFITREVAK